MSLNTDKKINIAYYKYINKYLENIALFHFFFFYLCWCLFIFWFETSKSHIFFIHFSKTKLVYGLVNISFISLSFFLSIPSWTLVIEFYLSYYSTSISPINASTVLNLNGILFFCFLFFCTVTDIAFVVLVIHFRQHNITFLFLNILRKLLIFSYSFDASKIVFECVIQVAVTSD